MLNGFPILNTFPELLALEHLAPFILRVTLGVIMINIGYLKWKGEFPRWKIFAEALGFTRNRAAFIKGIGVLEYVSGVALIIGLYTQLASLLLVILSGIELYAEHKESALVKRDIVFYILIFSIALSLLFSGAGAFSLDLPL